MPETVRCGSRSRWIKPGLAVLSTALIAGAAMSGRAQTIPSDPSPTCTVPSTTFATWFQSGSPALNGVVNPANSVAFPNLPNCSFYLWAKQMFLWLTSPAPSVYGGGGIIIDSPVFYDVSPPDASGQRTLLKHVPGFIHPFGVRAAQVGPLGLPVIFDRAGRMLEVERTQNVVGAQLRIRNSAGALVTVAHAARGANGALILRDARGAVIERRPVPLRRPPSARLRAAPLLVQEFVIDRIPILLDPFGNVVEVEQGQADGAVLEAQNGSLIYYAIMVNDVYAYFLTGVKDGQIQPGNPSPQFPTTSADLNAITSFAALHGVNFVDADALTVEVKSSWVDASTVANPNSYVTITAQVPTYNTASSTTWTPNGTKTIKLAMVGMHVVGSTAGHPEMIWATFEHIGNTPDAAYQYVNSHGVLTTVAQNTAGTWLFAASNSTGPFNNAHMQQAGANIQSVGSFTISPSNTIRWKAWGAGSDLSPNPIDGTAAASNTEIISINDNISGMMPSGDVRNNYIMTGATWTILGEAPLPVFAEPSPPDVGNQVGTSQLANSTMETYQQGVDNTAGNGGSNCFSCHSSPGSPIDITVLSHVFGAIKPLF